MLDFLLSPSPLYLPPQLSLSAAVLIRFSLFWLACFFFTGQRILAGTFILSSLGRVFRLNKQYNEAEEKFTESIFLLQNIYKSLTDSIESYYVRKKTAITISNLGELYRTEKKYECSLKSYIQAKAIFTLLKFKKRIIYAKGNIGLVYVAQNKLESAQIYLQDAITYLEEQNDNYAASSYMDGLAELYLKQNKIHKAF